MRPRAILALVGVALGIGLAGCGGGTRLLPRPVHTTTTASTSTAVSGSDADAAARLGFPGTATRNTTRVAGADPIADAAAVALAVYPSDSPGSHPAAVTLAPTDDWEAALAASVLMASPLHAPVLLSGASSEPAATRSTLAALAPTGAGSAGGAQVVRVGDVPAVGGRPSVHLTGGGPYALAASIDRFQAAAAGRETPDVVVASSAHPELAMPAAGYAAESGDPLLFVSPDAVPAATRQALAAHRHPRIFVVGGRSAIGPAVVRELSRLGSLRRIGSPSPAANSADFAAYRFPACAYEQPCAHVPGAFGWALRSPGHGYTLLASDRTLDAAASAALSGSGDYGPQLLVDNPSTLPRAVLAYFLNYATPGYTDQGPTAAVYNHGWVIGGEAAIGAGVQSELDTLLQAVPQSTR